MALHNFIRLTQKLALASGIVGLSLLPGLSARAEVLVADNHGEGMSEEMEAGEMGSEEMSPEGMSQEEGMSPEEMTTPAADTSIMSIVEVASGNDSFDTLVQAVQAADLAGTLSGPGPYTVFAPTDEAFAELPDGALAFLLQPENKALLQQVLTYHVVPGEVMASDLSTGSIDALGGGLAIRVAPDRVIVNNGSVVQADVQASNGVIHAVNRVLLPSALRAQLVSALEAQG
ncbi:fasciclin domain-containing protein [Romeria aff. gracilis LEGE 07310]|uniref:Fasciclin domain-containing protein n=1 Tax=Vasconcelosia minhoensis LEGE 07310 TaxID=915328 RepID=A0A8J7DCP6_9CYAN|nr:fasciclin domain-containing protein [Romeria gracilis]MBE9077888.1 fasciclin domain-containing protein [Romeria aff. gracilis LEGE 07310]